MKEEILLTVKLPVTAKTLNALVEAMVKMSGEVVYLRQNRNPNELEIFTSTKSSKEEVNE